jgi:4-aminobutyrate aminotransferase/(S)-3-amino-2-methylpropionate transaminase
MLKGLKEMCKQYPHLIDSARGLGTFCAFNGVDPRVRDQIVSRLKNAGVLNGGCGDRTVRIRPSLIFTQKHADIFLDKLNGVLKSF